MKSRHRLALALSCSVFLLFAGVTSQAQELPKSGTSGLDLVYATSPSGVSQLFAVVTAPFPAALPVGAPIASVPSRWAHRRRTLGALETSMLFMEEGIVMTPMGDAVGNGAIHLVDVRSGSLVTTLVPTGNPASYDLAVSQQLKYVFAAEDDGSGNTLLRGFSYATAGSLTPLNPPSLTLSGTPSAGVNRMGVSPSGTLLHVPTALGVHVISLQSAAPEMTILSAVASGLAVPVTNPTSFDRNGTRSWVIGTSTYAPSGGPTEAGFLVWDASGAFESGVWGLIPGLSPSRSYVPAAGTTELAVVGNGIDTYAYFLLRDPSPTAFFIRPSGIGVVRLIGSSPAVPSTIIYPNEGGEPFAIPTVHGTRVAIESSQGPPFSSIPPDGGEPISILYTPLDPLGVGTMDGVLAVPSPLGGRISTKGLERPMWSRDGSRVVACTSHFPGAPNPGMPGIEVLNVPATMPLTFYNPPHYVVSNETSPYRSIIFPSSFEPRTAGAAGFLAGLSFVGNVFHNGLASIMLTPYGEIGQFNERSVPFVQSPEIPNFPAIPPPSFNDASTSIVPVPGNFGARRTTWNLIPGLGLGGLVMSAAIEDRIHIQPSGFNIYVLMGIVPAPQIAAPIQVSLPAGWMTTTEFTSL